MKSIVVIVFVFVILSCGDRSGFNETPERYKYKIGENSKAKYSSDSTIIRRILIKMLNERTGPFHLKIYDSETNLFVDSLIYSPDQRRMIVFAVVENSTTKMLKKVNNAPFFYDAYYLFCSRNAVDEPIRVYDYYGYILSSFYNYSEIGQALRDHCFNGLLGSEGEEQFYNVDDLRFWGSDSFEFVLANSKPTQE